jgi:parvulin-like peptidyl-prolyl isomerase
MEGVELTKYFLTQGPFAVLFVWLLFYVMKTNKEREARQEQTNAEREARLHDILEKFSEKYDVVIDELRDIKNKLGGGKK